MSLIYAIGEIHGCLTKLRSLLLRCEKHADGRPMSFVFVGDYIDRGPQSCGVIDCLIDLKMQHGKNVVTLMGNHEAMALAVGSVAYFGTYTVDEPSKTILLKIEASTLPNQLGFEGKRVINTLTADELKYTNTTAVGDLGPVVTSHRRAK